jgi:hypothetical protein
MVTPYLAVLQVVQVLMPIASSEERRPASLNARRQAIPGANRLHASPPALDQDHPTRIGCHHNQGSVIT